MARDDKTIRSSTGRLECIQGLLTETARLFTELESQVKARRELNSRFLECQKRHQKDLGRRREKLWCADEQKQPSEWLPPSERVEVYMTPEELAEEERLYQELREQGQQTLLTYSEITSLSRNTIDCAWSVAFWISPAKDSIARLEEVALPTLPDEGSNDPEERCPRRSGVTSSVLD